MYTQRDGPDNDSANYSTQQSPERYGVKHPSLSLPNNFLYASSIRTVNPNLTNRQPTRSVRLSTARPRQEARLLSGYLLGNLLQESISIYVVRPTWTREETR